MISRQKADLLTMRRRTSSRWEAISLMAIALLDAVQRTASRMVYQGAYSLSMVVPGNTRGKRKRAKFFAAKIEANAQRHVPAAIAILLNCMICLLFGTLEIREERGGDPESISVTVGTDDFLTETSTPEPAGGGGGTAAALQEMLNELPSATAIPTTLELPPELVASITTISPSHFTVPESATQPRPIILPALTTMNSPSTSKIGTGNETGAGLGSGSGTGSGAGAGTGNENGAGNGTGLGGESGNGTGAGTYSVAGLELPIGEKVWLVIDGSSSMERNSSRTARQIHRYADTEKNDGPDSRVISNSRLIEAGAKKGFKVIVWITDLQDHHGLKEGLNMKDSLPAIDPTFEIFTNLATVLKETGARLYVVSFGFDAYPSLRKIVEESGGSMSLIKN